MPVTVALHRVIQMGKLLLIAANELLIGWLCNGVVMKPSWGWTPSVFLKTTLKPPNQAMVCSR